MILMTMKIFIIILIALTPRLVLAQANAGLPDKPYIYVRGSAESKKAPDIVTLRFDLIGHAPERAKANDDVQTRAAKVFDMLAKRSIDKNDIIADDFRTEEEFEESEGNRKTQKVIGYTVRRSFDVKIRDVKIFPKLVDDLVATVNVEFSSYEGISEGYSKETEIGKTLWQDAVADSRAEAERTLKNTGMKVDSMYAISPVPIAEITSRIFPKGESTTGTGAEAENVIVTGSNIPTPEQRLPSEYRLTPISFRQIVHVIYLISPAKTEKN
jgi:uncharacterized protein YggE